MEWISEGRSLDTLPQELGVPRCYDVEEREDGSLWLWLEWVQSHVPSPWPLSRFRLAAYHLGLFHGPYLVGTPVPRYEWLSQGMTRIWLANTLVDGYIDGLRATGWQGDVRLVRVGFSISTLFQWGFAAAGWPVAIATDQSGKAERQTWEQWGRPMEEVYQQWAGLTYYLLDLAEEADALREMVMPVV
ncbi:MAG: aminoglycoside phosphotransferase [Chthonomonadaceae bacterium]|nr:aminoglycoside phosphotransferase [Chthonomonadaceae bacterium]